MFVNYRKNLVRELHNLKHRKKQIYQTLYHSNTKRYPEDYAWLDSLEKEYQIIEKQIQLLECICQNKKYYFY